MIKFIPLNLSFFAYFFLLLICLKICWLILNFCRLVWSFCWLVWNFCYVFVVGFCLCCYVFMVFSFLPSFLEASMLHCLKQQRAGYLLHVQCCCRPKSVFQAIIRSGIEASFIHCLKLHLFIASFPSLLGASLVPSFIPSLLGELFVHSFIAP